MPPFEFIGTEISERRVQPVWIVEAFEVISDGVLGCPPRRPRLAVNEPGLERRKKALSDGVVPAVTCAAHRADDAMVAQHSLIGRGLWVANY